MKSANDICRFSRASIYFVHPLQPEGPGLHVLQAEGEPPPSAPFHLTGLRILWVSLLRHFGQEGFSPEEKTSSSKTCLHDSHLYSKMGIFLTPR
jgi:hypothetical protein